MLIDVHHENGRGDILTLVLGPGVTDVGGYAFHLAGL